MNQRKRKQARLKMLLRRIAPLGGEARQWYGGYDNRPRSIRVRPMKRATRKELTGSTTPLGDIPGFVFIRTVSCAF